MNIDRALIIALENHPVSQEYAEQCASSCKANKLPYEIITAVDKNEFNSCQEILNSMGVPNKHNYTNTLGNVACHMSMVRCWKRIVEIGKPCIILEHDAIVLGDVTTVDIPDMHVVNFGFRVANSDDYSPPGPARELVSKERSIGVHACGLSPVTAKWLYDDIYENGIVVGVDKWLMMQRASGLPLSICEPPQVVCHVRHSTINDSDNRDLVNFPDSLTPGWKQGLKKA